MGRLGRGPFSPRIRNIGSRMMTSSVLPRCFFFFVLPFYVSFLLSFFLPPLFFLSLFSSWTCKTAGNLSETLGCLERKDACLQVFFRHRNLKKWPAPFGNLDLLPIFQRGILLSGVFFLVVTFRPQKVLDFIPCHGTKSAIQHLGGSQATIFKIVLVVVCCGFVQQCRKRTDHFWTPWDV